MDKYTLKGIIDDIDDSFFDESNIIIKREHLFRARLEGFATAVIMMVFIVVSSMYTYATLGEKYSNDNSYENIDCIVDGDENDIIDDKYVGKSKYSFINEYQIKLERTFFSSSKTDGYFIMNITKNEEIIKAKILGTETFEDGYMGVRLQLADNHNIIVFVEAYGSDSYVKKISARENHDGIMFYVLMSQSFGVKRIAVIPGDELSDLKIEELKKYIISYKE